MTIPAIAVEKGPSADIETSVRELLKLAGITDEPSTIRGQSVSITLVDGKGLGGIPPWIRIESVVRGLEIVPDGFQLFIDPDTTNLPLVGPFFTKSGNSGQWEADFYCGGCGDHHDEAGQTDPPLAAPEGWELEGFRLNGANIPLTSGKASA